MSDLGLVAVALGWVAGTVLLWRLPTPAGATDSGAAMAAGASVVVPARDEERTLPRLLDSLRAQVAPAARVIVVDDGSVDGTAAVARAGGATVVRAADPPPGWLGKPWACAQGVASAPAGPLVLLDADVTLAPDGLARLLSAREALAPGGLLSVQPFHEAGPGHEQLSALCNVVPVMASAMAAPGTSPSRVAFGPCLVTDTAALEAAGGFEVVKASVTEDVALAQAYRAAGRPVRCLGGGATVRFRMYPAGWRALVEGWSKNLAAGAASAPLLPTLGAVAWVAALAAVAVAGVSSLIGWAAGEGAPAVEVVVAWAAVSAQLAWMLPRLGSFRWWCWALFPVPLAAFVALFVRSLALRVLRRPVTWRGRRVDARAAGR